MISSFISSPTSLSPVSVFNHQVKMHSQILTTLTLSLSLLPALSSATPTILSLPQAIPKRDHPTLLNYGILLYRAFDAQDIFGPFEVLTGLARNYTMNLYMLSSSLDPVSTRPVMSSMNPTNSSFFPSILPSHTFADDPDLDVLIIPGGAGMRAPNMTAEIEYVKHVYPRLKYVITVCTGSAFLARTGLLDGRRATTNKMSWANVIGFGPKVKWVSPARWVVDGNIWTSAGVSLLLLCMSELKKVWMTCYCDECGLTKNINRSRRVWTLRLRSSRRCTLRVRSSPRSLLARSSMRCILTRTGIPSRPWRGLHRRITRLSLLGVRSGSELYGKVVVIWMCVCLLWEGFGIYQKMCALLVALWWTDQDSLVAALCGTHTKTNGFNQQAPCHNSHLSFHAIWR